MRRWDGLLDRYLQEGRSRGLADSTVESQRRELNRFGAWLKARRPRPSLEAIDSERILGYVRSRSAFRSRSTVAGTVSVLRNMGEFLVREGIWSTNPLRWMRGPKIDPRALLPRRVSRGALEKLWSAAGQRRTEYERYQAICALALLYATGMRRGELVRLNVDDWDRDAGVVTIDGRKTGQSRCVPVGEHAWRCIEAYLPHRHNRLEQTGCIRERALLVNRDGRRWRDESVSQMVKKLARRAGVEHVTLHQFRHSCASDLLDKGVSLPEVQRFLGHATLQTTVRYARVADPLRTEAIGQHPINEFLGLEGGA